MHLINRTPPSRSPGGPSIPNSKLPMPLTQKTHMFTNPSLIPPKETPTMISTQTTSHVSIPLKKSKGILILLSPSSPKSLMTPRLLPSLPRIPLNHFFTIPFSPTQRKPQQIYSIFHFHVIWKEKRSSIP